MDLFDVGGFLVTSVEGWSLELVDDVDLPGWVFLPEDLSPGDREVWLSEAANVLSDAIGNSYSEDLAVVQSDVRSMLEIGLAERAGSGSYLMYQVWPLLAPATVLCHVNVVASEDLPDWNSLDGVVHSADARYIGPGLQFSTRREIDGPEGTVELNSVHLAYDGGDVALLLTLEESLAPLVSRALVGFTLLKDALQLRKGDGTLFASAAPAGLVADEQWPTEDVRGVS